MTAEEIIIKVPGVKSLLWDGELLVDWAGGGQRISLDGSVQLSRRYYAYKFDSAVSSKSGRFTVLSEKLGTKALVLEQGKLLRELNRSYYHANAYEYPVTFLSLPDGTEAIVHCPREYCRIDIETAESGKCLTDHVDREPSDCFHSRLMSSPSGCWLASAGWVWHPFGVAHLWSIESVLADPRALDKSGIDLTLDSEVESIAFLDEERLAVSGGEDGLEGSTEESLSVLSAHTGSVLSRVELNFPAGTLVRFGPDQVLGLYEHPRLLSASDGSVIAEWPYLKTGKQTSSIIHYNDPIPAFAKHPTLPMFAVADAEKVTVVRMR